MSRNMSRNTLIFLVTTMLGAVALAPIASANPPTVQTKLQKFFAAKKAAEAQAKVKADLAQEIAAALKKAKATPKIDWAKMAAAKFKASKPFGPMGIKIHQQPVFVHHVPVFIPDHPYRPDGPRYAPSYSSAPGPSYASAAPGPSYAAAPTPTYQAIGLAWNHDGAFAVEQATTLDEASANALAKCNAQYGGCEVSAQSVSEASFACLAVARSADDAHRLFASRAGSQDELQANLASSMSDAGTTGDVEYAACNAGS